MSDANSQSSPPLVSSLKSNSPSFPSPILVLRQSRIVLKKRWPTLLRIQAIGLISLILAGGIVSTLMFQLFLLGLWQSSMVGIFSLTILVLALIIIIVCQSWQLLALIYAIKDRQEEIGAIEAYQRSWKKIIPYCWTSILLTFIIIGGFSLLVIPGIIFLYWFMLAIYVCAAEDLGGINALLKSRAYLRGHWIKTTLHLLVSTGSFGILSYLLSLIDLSIFLTGPIWTLGIRAFIVIGKILLSWIVSFWPMVYMFLFYENVRAGRGELDYTTTKGKKALLIALFFMGLIITAVTGILFSRLISQYSSFLPASL
jgi:hypothetical protein